MTQTQPALHCLARAGLVFGFMLLQAACGDGGAVAPDGGRAPAGGGAPAKAQRVGAVDRCGGTPLQIAQRDLKKQENPTGTAEQIAATLEFLEPEAPLYPCAEQLFAVSPPDGSGTAKFNFQTRDNPAAVVAYYRQEMAAHGNVELDDSGPVHSVILNSNDLFVGVHVHPTDEDGIVAVYIEKEGTGGDGEAQAKGPGEGAEPAANEKPIDLPPRLVLNPKLVKAGVSELGPNPAGVSACGEALNELADTSPGILLSGVFSQICKIPTERQGTIGLYIQAKNRPLSKTYPKPININLACEVPKAFAACWERREPFTRLPPNQCLYHEYEVTRRAGLRKIGECLIAKAQTEEPAFDQLRNADAGQAR